jgi:AcrR family transcriptional regulator
VTEISRLNDARVREAAREVFATRGYDAPVAAIAEAAGVGMGSLYRRYGSKDDLLADLCLRSMVELADLATAALADPDPGRGFAAFVRNAVAARCGAFAGVAGAIPVSPEMIAAAKRSQELTVEVLRAAQAAGAVRRDVTAVDVLRLVELFSRSPRADGDQPIRARLLALAIDGLTAHDAPPLPAPAPTMSAYRDRWNPR